MPGARTKRGEAELQERDLAILQALFESRLMTLNHITHLFFNGHGEAAKKRIQRLKEDRYIRERIRRVYQPSILHLSRRSFAALSERGMLLEYPQLAWNQLEDRAKVSESTLRHEIQVVDVKTAFSRAIRSTPHYDLIEFSTWPLLYQFEAAQPAPPGTYQGARVLIKPDGFVRLHEEAPEGDLFEHFLFLEVDRSTESRETLARRAFGYQDFYRRGGLAVRYGATQEEYKDFPFRVGTPLFKGNILIDTTISDLILKAMRLPLNMNMKEALHHPQKVRPKQYVLKNDEYRRVRGGTATLLNLFCSACRHHFLVYQKDGPGKLLRCYLNRIFAPPDLAHLRRWPRMRVRSAFPRAWEADRNPAIALPAP